MTESTARFGLPLIVPGQAQKEMFHNEALARIDMAVSPAVEEARSEPPPNPQAGQCWLIAAGAAGDWEGREDALACWTAGGWRYLEPVPGMLVWKKDVGLQLHWTGSGWSEGELAVSRIIINGAQVLGERQDAVPSPYGGTTIDQECRAAVEAIIVALRSHGLTD